MGYWLYITRQESLLATDGPEIALDEWMTLLLGEPEWAITHEFDTRVRAEWLRAPDDTEQGLEWEGGTIQGKRRHPDIIPEMHRLAARLNARVFGESGEEYGASGEVIAGHELLTRESDPEASFWDDCLAIMIGIPKLCLTLIVFGLSLLWVALVALVEAGWSRIRR